MHYASLKASYEYKGHIFEIFENLRTLTSEMAIRKSWACL